MSDLLNKLSGAVSGQSGANNSAGMGTTSGGGMQQTGEKKDWLDKGIAAAGKKLGVNVSDRNADKVGDFANNQFSKKEGHGLPGVH
ncbi:uncharacterized protein BXZ73DRAFT_98480 [Epithele typhae]|uniref:uncharacterized protein n=1 Tax=Epithele typhae TaxID=378194 RepID=UPI0020072586|nr:uncharacterized protein BXZ73DRAFT_98480 [Epithele typhae]KAH9941262.1 hypothetical protein BXZ73DRAFT_98480 [Epithele typhae]